VTTNILEHSQLAHHAFDAQLAGTLLERYADSLDPSRSILLQGDVDEFAAQRATLAEGMRGPGNTPAAQAIFARYLERAEERSRYAADVLRHGSFDFTGNDVYSFDRSHAPRPHDLHAAEAQWLQELRAEYLTEKLTHKPAAEIVATLTERHARQLEAMKKFTPDEVLDLYLDTLAHVYDPHSDYLGHEQMESLSIAMNLSLVGIGATLESSDGYCKIRELVPGGPAARSGLLKAGDRIVAVAQAGGQPVDIVNLPLSRIVELIRGPKGSRVTLSVIPGAGGEAAARKQMLLVRDEIKLEDQEAHARIVDVPSAGGTLRLGIVDLPSFYAGMKDHGAGTRSATADVARLLTRLKRERVQGVVLDLRRNGGGSLSEAISLTGLFIRKGPVVQTRDQSGTIEVGADTDSAVQYDGPLVVLTSRFSASASEILAGALQDYGRALIVGDTSTFGKGTVQSIVPLAPIMDRAGLGHSYDPGALKVTISKFYRPSGASTQLRGVASDIVLPSTSDFDEVSESALKDPLPWDTIPPAAYEPLDRVAPFVGTLRASSARRVAADKGFLALAGDIGRLRETVANKSISLNEASRSQMLAADKARGEQAKREEQSAHALQPATYEVTPENAGSPGLSLAKVSATQTSRNPHDPSSGVAVEPASDAPANDVVLKETEQILSDYVGLLHHAGA
jgi:carboxyl-terminal processing protease